MKAIAMYILLSFVRVLIKNCKTIFLAKEDATRACLLAGVNAVLAANLVKMVVELNILTATLIAFFCECRRMLRFNNNKQKN